MPIQCSSGSTRLSKSGIVGKIIEFSLQWVCFRIFTTVFNEIALMTDIGYDALQICMGSPIKCRKNLSQF